MKKHDEIKCTMFPSSLALLPASTSPLFQRNLHAKNEFYKFTYFPLFQSLQHISYLYIYVSIECFLILKVHFHMKIMRPHSQPAGERGKELLKLRAIIIIIFIYVCAQRVEKNHGPWVHNFQNDIINALHPTWWIKTFFSCFSAFPCRRGGARGIKFRNWL